MFQILKGKTEDNRDAIILDGSFLPEFDKHAERFFSQYEAARILESRKDFRFHLGPRSKRICRFCGRKAPAAKFKSAAHLIPKHIGNKHLFSDFECDDCNHLFGTYESQLVDYLGIAYAFIGDPADERTPTLKDPSRGIRVQHGNFTGETENNKIEFISERPEQHFRLDLEKQTLSVSFQTKPYVPLSVYKALLKSALSTVNEKFVTGYRHTIDFLTDRVNYDNQLADIAKVAVFFHSGPYFPAPRAILFQKSRPSDPIPTHCFILQFLNRSFQIFLPFYEADAWLHQDTKDIELPVAPPFIQPWFAEKYGLPELQFLRLHSSEQTTRQQEQVFRFSGVEFPV